MSRLRYNLQVVLHFSGSLLIALGFFLLVPLIPVFLYREFHQSYGTVSAFLIPSVLSLSGGIGLSRLFRAESPTMLQSIFICTLGWLVFSAIGALPFVWGIQSSFLDGFFEAMSGFTTTGITVFTGLDRMPKSIIFWRAWTQWIGGLGILTMFLAVNSRKGSTYHLFGAKGHKIEVARPVPGMTNTIEILLSIYIGFTLFIALALFALDMSFFDSLCHSFSALATGGFSPHDASIEYYRLAGYPNYVWYEYILILGMILGGSSFVVHYRVISGGWKALWDNTESRCWWIIIGVFSALILLERAIRSVPPGFSVWDEKFFWRIEENFRLTLFQVVSIITTTGFLTRDIGDSYFGELARQLFLVLMVIGGCVGSTGGGIKVLRAVLLTKIFRREVYRLRVPPQAITSILVDGQPLDQNEIQRVTGLFFAWMVLLVFGGLITELFSHQTGYAAFSGMFSALGNVGPCYIAAEEICRLHPVIKIVYIFGMLAGRLEIIPLFIFLNYRAWKS